MTIWVRVILDSIFETNSWYEQKNTIIYRGIEKKREMSDRHYWIVFKDSPLWRKIFQTSLGM